MYRTDQIGEGECLWRKALSLAVSKRGLWSGPWGLWHNLTQGVLPLVATDWYLWSTTNTHKSSTGTMGDENHPSNFIKLLLHKCFPSDCTNLKEWFLDVEDDVLIFNNWPTACFVVFLTCLPLTYNTVISSEYTKLVSLEKHAETV